METEGGADAAPATQKKQLRLSYAEYHTMANLIVHYLRRKEAEAEESGQQGDAMPGNEMYTHSMVYVGRNRCYHLLRPLSAAGSDQ